MVSGERIVMENKGGDWSVGCGAKALSYRTQAGAGFDVVLVEWADGSVSIVRQEKVTSLSKECLGKLDELRARLPEGEVALAT